MLTVDFDRLGVGVGHRLLDMGCGGGRHVFEAARRGATVVALDRSETELKDVRGTLGAMADAGELPDETPGCVVTGDALALPLPDDSVDRIIAAEVLEHVPADEIAMAELVRVLRPSGRIAVTVPSFLPERVCWWLNAEYHETPGGHVRIYTLDEITKKLTRAGLRVEAHARTHALHSPYWWLKCAVGVSNDENPLVSKYHDFLVYDLTHRPAWTTNLDRTLSPVLGKSLVIYAEKRAAARGVSPRAASSTMDTEKRAAARGGSGSEAGTPPSSGRRHQSSGVSPRAASSTMDTEQRAT